MLIHSSASTNKLGSMTALSTSNHFFTGTFLLSCFSVFFLITIFSFQYLSSQHLNFKFNCAAEQNKKLLLLDISITFLNDCFSINTYRKPTFTGLGSYIPYIHKIKSLKTLIMPTSYILRGIIFTQTVYLKDHFTLKGFPCHLIF